MASRSALQGKTQAALRWCASVPPPPALTSHLTAHDIALASDPSVRVAAPTRVATISSAAVRIVGKRATLEGRRLAVLHPEPGAADALAQTLRQRGAQVAVLNLDPAQLARAEALDPEVIVVEPRHFAGSCWPALASVFQHPQLRWTCVLVSATEGVDGIETHDLPGLCAQVQLLSADYDAAVARARTAQEFEVSLDTLGPSRVLRLLVQSGKSFRALFNTGTLTMEIDVAEGLVVGARGGRGRIIDDTLLGTPGLNVLLRESHGFVRARPVARPAVTNIMCPLDTALAGASHGRELPDVSLVRSSVRPAGKGSLPTPSASISGVRTISARTLIGIPAVAAHAAPGSAVASAAAAASAPYDVHDSSASESEASLTVTSLAVPANDNDRASAVRNSAAPQARQASAPAGLPLVQGFDPTVALPASVRSSLAPDQRVAPLSGRSSQAPSVRTSQAPSGRTSLTPARTSQTPDAPRGSLAPKSDARNGTRSVGPAAQAKGALARTAGRLFKPMVASVVAGSVALTLSALWPDREMSVASPLQGASTAASLSAGAAAATNAPVVDTLPSGLAPAAAMVAAIPPGVPVVYAGAAADAPASAGVAQPALVAGTLPTVAGLAEPPSTAPISRAANATTAGDGAVDVKSAGGAARRATVSRTDSRRASALAKRANTLLRKGLTTRAKSTYEAALAASPTNPRALSGLVHLALKQRDAKLAREHALTLARVRPHSASTQLLLGDAQRLNGEFASARAAWTRAARLGSTEARARLRSAPQAAN